MQLRPYQEEAVDAILDSDTNDIIAIPTGAGKSLIQAELIRSYLPARILCLAHVKELLEQNESELLRLLPDIDVGVYSAGLSRREMDKPVVIAGIQSVYDKAEEIGYVDYIIVDEVHRFDDANPDSMYMQLYDKLFCANPNLRIIGMTATPFRTKKGLLTRKPSIWDRIAYSADLKQMMDDGYLCRVTTRKSTIQADLANVDKTAGDYVMSQAAGVMGEIQEEAIEEIISQGRARKHWLIFACTIEHAKQIATRLRKKGISAAYVSGDMMSFARDEIIADFKAGKYQALVNVNILTTGFNFPAIDLIATLRPTKSAIIYVQSVGRGTRVSPDKDNCLVLDYAGWVDEFGPLDLVKISPRRGYEVAPHKTCKQCRTEIHAGYKECPECGYEFPVDPLKIKHSSRATSQAIMSDEVKQHMVRQVAFTKHYSKRSGIYSMRVMYSIGMFHQVSEWVCFDHPKDNYAYKQAVKWWGKFATGPIPPTVDEALSRTGEITPATHINVRKENGWDKVIWD